MKLCALFVQVLILVQSYEKAGVQRVAMKAERA